jgi:hypothetical protein
MDVLKMYSFCCNLGVVTVGAIQNFVIVVDFGHAFKFCLTYFFYTKVIDIVIVQIIVAASSE